MKEFNLLHKTIKKLRSPSGCPWDRAQKLPQCIRYILEETYELIDAISRKHYALVKEELGDIFLLLIFISELYQERGKFTLKSVLGDVNKKLIRRHPHVFSKIKLNSKEEVLKMWIKSKARKKKRKNISQRLPSSAPSLLLSEIFLKEIKNSNNSYKNKEFLKNIYPLKSKIKKDKEKELTNQLWKISQTAFLSGINLELSFREFILKEARKVKYI